MAPSAGAGGASKGTSAQPQELSLLWSRLTERDRECATLRTELASAGAERDGELSRMRGELEGAEFRLRMQIARAERAELQVTHLRKDLCASLGLSPQVSPRDRSTSEFSMLTKPTVAPAGIAIAAGAILLETVTCPARPSSVPASARRGKVEAEWSDSDGPPRVRSPRPVHSSCGAVSSSARGDEHGTAELTIFLTNQLAAERAALEDAASAAFTDVGILCDEVEALRGSVAYAEDRNMSEEHEVACLRSELATALECTSRRCFCEAASDVAFVRCRREDVGVQTTLESRGCTASFEGCDVTCGSSKLESEAQQFFIGDDAEDWVSPRHCSMAASPARQDEALPCCRCLELKAAPSRQDASVSCCSPDDLKAKAGMKPRRPSRRQSISHRRRARRADAKLSSIIRKVAAARECARHEQEEWVAWRQSLIDWWQDAQVSAATSSTGSSGLEPPLTWGAARCSSKRRPQRSIRGGRSNNVESAFVDVAAASMPPSSSNPSAGWRPEPPVWPGDGRVGSTECFEEDDNGKRSDVEETDCDDRRYGVYTGADLDDVGLSDTSCDSEVGQLRDFRGICSTTGNAHTDSEDVDDVDFVHGMPTLVNCSKESRLQAKGAEKASSAVKKLFKLPKGLRQLGHPKSKGSSKTASPEAKSKPCATQAETERSLRVS